MNFKTFLNPKSNLSKLPHSDEKRGQAPAMAGGRAGWRYISSNFPLLFGGVIVFGLFLLILFGPVWAPINPYIAGQHVVPHLDKETGEWIAPPLAPSAQYPLGTDQWGNDILSMLMYGARNTLIAGAFITMARVLLGLGLGSIAGWNEGKQADRFIMGMSGVITAVPTLISGMILIYALDIRRGLPVFIIALTLIGWTEIAQYIRSEFLIIRKMPYIEGARAAGSNSLGIAIRHALPNLLPQLLVIIFLEFGAVLLLMGELAFIGVFIGGGSRIATGDEIQGAQFTLAEIPEWGAMLADGYRWLTSKPFIVLPPALAFFIAIVGFNTFGEGLRRLLEQTHVNTSFLLKKRMIAVILAITLATAYIVGNTGPAPWFAKMAQAFGGDGAYVHTETLAEMNGRSPNSIPHEEAAEYIAEKFTEYGLQPGWKHLEYIYPMEMMMTRPLSQPQLAIIGEDGSVLHAFTHQLEFGYMIEGHGGGGDVELPLTFVGFADGSSSLDWESYRNLDLHGRIVLLLEGAAPADFAVEAQLRGAEGVLWIVDDDKCDASARCDALRSQTQFADPNGDYMRAPRLPIFRINDETAVSLLDTFGISRADLADSAAADQQGDGWYSRDLDGAAVQMKVELSEPELTAVPTVLGYLPGSDLNLADELVIIYAHFDGLGSDPDGTVFPAVNHNASGMGIMLETARLWQEQELEPRRPVLFVAWGAGTLDNSGGRAFVDAEQSFLHLPTTARLKTTAVFQLDYAGAGDDQLFIHPASNARLAELVKETAVEIGIEVVDGGETAVSSDMLDPRAPWVYFAWDNAPLPPDQDTLDHIDPEKLRSYGQLLALSLAKIVRQSRY